MDSDRDLYHILQVDPAAEPEVVQAAYKRLALKHHPDRNASPDAHARMQELNEAYAIISDPAQREAYDVLRCEKSKTQRLAEEQARQEAEAARREAAARKRKEQMAAQRRAANEQQAQARVTAEQRRIEYEEQIRAQQAAQMRAKRERRQRESAARQAAEQAAAQPAPQAVIEPTVTDYVAVVIEDLATASVVTPAAQVEVEPTPEPVASSPLSECDRRRLALQQSQQALQNEIFKLNYGITDAAEQATYWQSRRFPLQIEIRAGQKTTFMIGGSLTVVALLLAAFMLTLGGTAGWAAAFGLVGMGVGGWTWRTSLAIEPVGRLAKSWTEIKRGRELQRQNLVEELEQLEGVMQVSAAQAIE